MPEPSDLSPKDRLDSYEYRTTESENPVARLLWWAAGADPQLLAKCPHSDRVRFEGIGGVVAATAALAFVSSSYAIYTVFSPKVGTALNDVQQTLHWPTLGIALAFGVVWSLIIFNLDRFVVSSSGHGDGTEKITFGELVNALPRIAMAVVIGLSLSAPLEIRIMKTEIESQLELEQRDYLQELNSKDEKDFLERKDELKKRVAATQARVDEKVQYFDKRRSENQAQARALDEEAEGKTRSGMPGEGPAYASKKRHLDDLKAELEHDKAEWEPQAAQLKASMEEDSKEIASLEQKLVDKKDQNARIAHNRDGLVKRIQIADAISWKICWVLRLLLIIVEVAPIFFKMMLVRGTYDRLEENQKLLAVARRAIQPASGKVIAGEGNGLQEVKFDTYYEFDALIEHEKGRLAKEEELTKVAQEAFAKDMAERIRKDPGSYMEAVPKPVGMLPRGGSDT